MASVLMGVVQEVGDGFIRLGAGSQIRVPSAVWKPGLVVGVRVSVRARLLGAEWIADDIVLEGKPQPIHPRLETGYDTLRSLIRAKLLDARLSRGALRRVWGAHGNGQMCDACDQTVTKSQIMIEGMRVGDLPTCFHVECFSIWDHERLVR